MIVADAHLFSAQTEGNIFIEEPLVGWETDAWEKRSPVGHLPDSAQLTVLRVRPFQLSFLPATQGRWHQSQHTGCGCLTAAL